VRSARGRALFDRYAGVKGDMEEKAAAAAEEQAQRIAEEGEPEKRRLSDRMSGLRKAARGRLGRFSERLKAMARRKKKTPLTYADAMNEVTSSREQYMEELQRSIAERRKKRD
jgi:hypothetical protein